MNCNESTNGQGDKGWLVIGVKHGVAMVIVDEGRPVDLVYCPVFNTSALLVRQARRCSGNKSSTEEAAAGAVECTRGHVRSVRAAPPQRGGARGRSARREREKR